MDSGNEEYVGQVVLGYKPPKVPRKLGAIESAFILPDVTYFFPDMLESKDIFASELSCADHAVSHPQAAITNITAATLLLQFCTAILTNNITFHKITFDAQCGSFNTTFNWPSKLSKYLMDISQGPTNKVEENIISISKVKETPTDKVIHSEVEHIAPEILLDAETLIEL